MKLNQLLFAAAAAACTFVAPVASALSYDVNTLATAVGLFNGNTPNDFLLGEAYLYKQNNGGSEEGSLAANLQTVFSNNGTTATITKTGGGILPTIKYLAIKASTDYYVWDISSINSGNYDSLVVNNTVLLNNGNPRNISHVSLYGSGTPRLLVQTADGGSMLALLGLGLGATAFARRRLS